MITYSEIRNMQRREKESSSIQDLGDDFLQEISEYLQDKKNIISKNKKDNNPFSKEMEERARVEMENAIRVVDILFQLREKKIIYHAILSAKKEISIHNTSNMLEHEKKLFEKTLDTVKQHRNNVSKAITSAEKVKKGEGVGKTKLVRFLDDVAPFVWNNKSYGPFSKEDMGNLSEELSDLLTKRGKVEEIKDENSKEK